MKIIMYTESRWNKLPRWMKDTCWTQERHHYINTAEEILEALNRSSLPGKEEETYIVLSNTTLENYIEENNTINNTKIYNT